MRIISFLHPLAGPAKPSLLVLSADADQSGEGETETITRELVAQHIHRMEIGKEMVTLLIADGRADAALLRVRFDQSDLIEEAGDGFQLKIPIRLKTWGGEKIVEGPNGGSPTAHAHIDESLTIALVRAFSWREQLADGSARSLEEIAIRERCTQALRTQPRHVTVDRLVRMTLPLSWRDQRQQLGLAR
jgi:site-specific DNA recombinase